MAMLKTTTSHDPCAMYIQKYLEIGPRENPDRVLAQDFLNLNPHYQKDWASWMDRTRERFGLVGDYKGNKRRTFEHIIISPDPKDGIGLEDLRKLATEYAATLFGNEVENKDGYFGKAQVAITYHNDNQNHIPHAHIIVNRCDLNTGKALHFSNTDNKTTLPDTLQKIAKEMGLSYFDNSVVEAYKGEKSITTVPKETEKRTPYLTKAERALKKDNKFSWKEHLREAISIAARTTKTETQFLDQLEKMGINAKPTVRDESGQYDWIFSMKENPTRWRSSGYRLGKGWTRQAIVEQQQNSLRINDARREEIREQINEYILKKSNENKAKHGTATPCKHIPSTRAKNFRLNFYIPQAMPIYQVSEIYYFHDTLGLNTREDFEKMAKRLNERAITLSSKHNQTEQAQRATSLAVRVNAVVRYIATLEQITKTINMQASKTGQKNKNNVGDELFERNTTIRWVHDKETGITERRRIEEENSSDYRYTKTERPTTREKSR